MNLHGVSLCCIVFSVANSVANAVDTLAALDAHLFSSYNPCIPAGDDLTVTPIRVKIDMSLTRIIQMDEDTHIVQTNVWLRWQWNDSRLIWDPIAYGNVTSYVTTTKTWTPDVTLYNEVRTSAEPHTGSSANVRIQSDGVVQWQAPVTYRTTCESQAFYFPFERMHCRFKFGSWGYHSGEVKIVSMEETQSKNRFLSTGEWLLREITASSHDKEYGCSPNVTYRDVTFFAVLQRQGGYYVSALLLPVFFMLLLAGFSFQLPAGNGEKATLAAVIYLAQMVFYLVVNKVLPKHWNVTYIGIFLMFAEGTLLLATLLNIIIVHVHFRGKLGLLAPAWMHDVIVRRLTRLIQFSDTVDIYQKKQQQVERTRKQSLKCEFEASFFECDFLSSTVSVTVHEPPSNDDLESNENYLLQKMILEQFEYMSNEMTNRSSTKSARQEWALMAMIIDRVCFYIYMTTFSGLILATMITYAVN